MWIDAYDAFGIVKKSLIDVLESFEKILSTLCEFGI